MTTKLTLLALLLSLTGILGCMNKIPVVAHYQKKATETCEAKYTPEQCRALSYPACNENGCHQ